MDINLSLSPATTIINKLAVVIYKASAPNTAEDYQEFDPPHTNPRNITFAGVDLETYIVNTYETTGMPNLGTLRHSFIYDPSFSKAAIRPTEFLYMTKGETSYTDSDWSTWEIDTIERVGVGTQYPSVDVGYYIDGNGYRRDGFDLLGDGDEFQENEKFVVRFKPLITFSTPVVQSARVFTGVELITADTLIDDTYNGKLLLVRSNNLTVTLTFKSIATLGAFNTWGVVSNGGNQVSTILKSEAGADLFQFAGDEVDEIILGQSEQIQMMGDLSEGWIVLQASPTILQAGEFIDAYSTTIEPNVLHCAGQEVSRATYRRLWLAVEAMSNGLVSESTWQTTTGGANNKGNFSSGNGTTTFRLPQIYSAGVLKAVDGSTRVPGSYESDQMIDHHHDTLGKQGGSNANGTGPAKYRGFFTQGAVGTTDLTSKPTNTSGAVLTNIGAENKIKNYGVFKLVRI